MKNARAACGLAVPAKPQAAFCIQRYRYLTVPRIWTIIMLDDLSREVVAGVVDRLVDELLEAGAVNQPPVDAIALAQRHLGMQVCLDRRQPQRGRAQRAAGRRQIYLRPEPNE